MDPNFAFIAMIEDAMRMPIGHRYASEWLHRAVHTCCKRETPLALASKRVREPWRAAAGLALSRAPNDMDLVRGCVAEPGRRAAS